MLLFVFYRSRVIVGGNSYQDRLIWTASGSYTAGDLEHQGFQKMGEEMSKIAENYPIGPCELPLECDCGTTVTEDNVVYEECLEDCETCDYCGNGKCPKCKQHVHCGGCI